ncbi:hypothetical protein K8R04_01720 [Candidatus Uhrbacteria bacterium]|nr:hypothetical protein [Candidatus Uhrbacteria bacterium]
MINDPCGFCGVAYGHKGPCPSIIKDIKAKTKATEDWQRGKDEAGKGLIAKPADKANGAYELGRDYHELEVRGQTPKPRRRSIRVPVKSEPRLAAVPMPAPAPARADP